MPAKKQNQKNQENSSTQQPLRQLLSLQGTGKLKSINQGNQ